MITETKGYKTCDADGKNVVFHPTLEAAQEHAIKDLLRACGLPVDDAKALASNMVAKKSELLTILTGQRGKDKQPRKRKATQEVKS